MPAMAMVASVVSNVKEPVSEQTCGIVKSCQMAAAPCLNCCSCLEFDAAVSALLSDAGRVAENTHANYLSDACH